MANDTDIRTSGQPGKGKRFFKTLLKTATWFIGIWLLLLVMLQVILSSSVLTGIVNRYAAEYVDGEVSFGKVSVSMFRDFPSVSMSLDDFSVTYPSDRFDAEESGGVQGELMYQGTGEHADTLASFLRLSASMNLASLMTGNININHLRLTRPRIFAHRYADGKANWDMFMFASTKEEEDTTGMSLLPKIALGRISLSGKPHVVYTDCKDTLFAMIDIGRAAFDGRLSTRQAAKRQIGLTLDSILVAGRMASDTLAFRLQQMYIYEKEKQMDVGIAANAMFLTRNYGRLSMPLTLEGTLNMPKDSIPRVQITNMLATIAGVPIELDANIGFGSGKTYIEAMAEIPQWEIDLVLKDYVSHFIPEVEKIKTDATVSLLVACFGEYDHMTGRLPSVSASLSIPESYVTHSDLDMDVRLAMEANIYNDVNDKIMLDISDVALSASGLDLSATGKARDIIGDDPDFDIDGSIKASLDSLVRFIPDSIGIKASGDILAKIQGSAKLSQLNLYNFSYSDLLGELHGDDIYLSIPKDTVNARINGLDIRITPEDMTSRNDTSLTYRMLGIRADIADADISYKESMTLKGHSIVLSAKNSAMETSDTTARKTARFGGRMTAGNILFRDAVSASIELENTVNAFQLIPKRENPDIPVLSVTSKNDRINLSTETNRVILADAGIRAEAAMNSIERRKRWESRLDSLAMLHPGADRDSLISIIRSKPAGRQEQTAETEDDFKDMDLDIRLDETLAKYFREWDLDGKLNVGLGLVMTPYLPLENYLNGLDIDFNNNEIKIGRLGLEAGGSIIEGKGKIRGLRRALSGRRGSPAPLDIDLELNSERIDANELMAALNAGLSFDPTKAEGKSEISDEDFFEQVLSDTVVTEHGNPLLVIPSNINAEIALNASDISYSDLSVESLSARFIAQDRCIQITDTKAETNIGGISIEGFYAARSKKDIKAGFDFSLKEITADKVIDLMPAVDTMIPMLKSFKGMLDCEVAATASLDTSMNIIPSSINGVMRIGGKDMTISEDKDFRKIAEMLKFKNINEGKIDRMTVEGIISDNTLEVFPFVIQMDRYTMALSGIQNLDMSFKYHVSMIKSPMLFRFGVDLYGPDFDNLKFKIGKAKYKNANVPVFSSEIDKTRINLVSSIRNIFEKGVDNAIAEHQRQEAIAEHKKNIGYVEAVDMEMEELSDVQKTIIQGE